MPDREWRGLAIDDLDGIYLEVTRGFLVPPATRGVDYIVAARAGRVSGNRVADKLESILLEGYVRGDDPEEWLTNRLALLAKLGEANVTTGVLTVRSPDYGLPAGVVATINARVKNWVEGKIIAYRDQTWSVELESIDPDWVMTGP
jgi:hypothetical protein